MRPSCQMIFDVVFRPRFPGRTLLPNSNLARTPLRSWGANFAHAPSWRVPIPASRPDPRHAVLRIVNQIVKEQCHRGERCLTLLHAAKNETFTPGRWQSLSDAPDEPGAALAATIARNLVLLGKLYEDVVASHTAWAKIPTDGVAIPGMALDVSDWFFIRGFATLSVGHFIRDQLFDFWLAVIGRATPTLGGRFLILDS
jgi:hypothetical protein